MTDKPQLRRSLSLTLVTLYGLGNILGAGIYVLIGKVAGYAGTSSPLSFVIAMLIAGLTAFSYMELASRYPVSASVSVYLHKAFGLRLLSTVVGLLLVLGGIVSAAALSQGFAGYLSTLLPVPETVASLGLLLLLGIVASVGIGESARFASLFTLIEVFGLLLVLWVGRGVVGAIDLTGFWVIDPTVGFQGVLLGAFLAFYAFIGFEDMVNVAEEVKNPRRTLALAILISLGSATLLYLAVILVSLAAVSPIELANSPAPLRLVVERVSTIPPEVMSIIGLAATVNGVLVQIIMGARILFGLAREGWITGRLSQLHPSYGTPALATLLVVGLMMLASLGLPLLSLAQFTSFLVLTVFTLVNGSLIALKRRSPQLDDRFTVPIFVPILGAVSCIGILLAQL